MGMAVALPGRMFADDRARAWPPPPGGPGGSIDEPSRLVALAGEGFPATDSPTPPLDGTGGPVPGVSRWRGALDAFADELGKSPGHRLGSPTARFPLHFVRQWVDNLAPVGRFAVPRDARTSWTTNSSPDLTTAVSPIPFQRHFIMETFGPDFDPRVQADYWKNPQIQQSVVHRRLIADVSRMGDPYQPRLTRLAPSASYGQTTQVLDTKPGKAPRSPMVTAPSSGMGRFGPRHG